MKLRKLNNASKFAALLVLAPLVLNSCTGDTDGGSAADGAKTSDPYVDNGGSGAKLELEINSEQERTVGVGEEVEFRVKVTDPQGAPLQFVRVFCDTEQGVAILEPSRNGVALESTNANGFVSGSIGGLTPGSYVMECRAQSGFNLLDRTTIRVTGEVPAGFQGFPGAAGGNLGGGRIIDQTPDVDDGNGVRITTVTVTGANLTTGTASGPLDVERNGCRTTATPPVCTNEPFTFSVFNVNLRNDTNTNVFINTVEVRRRSTTVVSAQGVPIEVKKGGGTGTVSGQLTTGVSCSGSLCFNTGGTNNVPVSRGTQNYTFIITGTAEDGNSFEITRNASIQFDFVNNCATGSNAGSICP